MAQQYRANINGFWCHNETWDDALNWDGKHDEIFFAVNTKLIDANGVVTQNRDSESELMGDTWQLPGRIQAGSASDRGGIVTGDKFPTNTPGLRTVPLDGRRFPPYTIWEDKLEEGGDTVLLTPTTCEWDPGTGFMDGWLAWLKKTNTDYGPRTKDALAKLAPGSAPVFDAVSLGIDVAFTLAGLWSPLGQSMRRPIGLQRDPTNPNGALFNPQTIALNAKTADFLANANLQGLGKGILELNYQDDPYLRGVYSMFVQIEKISDADSTWPDGSVVRETSDAAVYVIFGNAKFHVPDPEPLPRLYGSWAAVRVVPDGALTAIDGVADDGTLLREEHSPYVWRMESGHKRHVTSTSVLARFGGWS